MGLFTRSLRADAGAATVEHAGLVALLGLLIAAGVLALAAGGPAGPAGGKAAAELVGRRIACSAALPGPCRRNPLLAAYPRGVAHAVRRHAPAPAVRTGPSGEALLPVDFRRCRRPSCAAPSGSSPKLTASNRRTSAFTLVTDLRRRDGTVRVEYWLYRPTMPWELVTARLERADIEAARGERITRDRVPVLVPLETLPGRNHHDFRAVEEPPWRWRIVG